MSKHLNSATYCALSQWCYISNKQTPKTHRVVVLQHPHASLQLEQGIRRTQVRHTTSQRLQLARRLQVGRALAHETLQRGAAGEIACER